MAAHSPLDADCSPGNELVQFVLSDVPLGLSKVAANYYTLYASHSRDVVSSGVQLALDRVYFAHGPCGGLRAKAGLLCIE
jgi:hypothetical protein